MDDYVYEKSLMSAESEARRFSKRMVVDLPDSNNQQYGSSQIQFQLPSLSTMDSFLSLRESSVSFPYVVRIASTEDLATDFYMAALKSGFQNLISGVSFKLDNQEVLSMSDNINIPLTWKIISQSSKTDEANLFDSIGFAMDTTETINYATGRGESNGLINHSALPALADSLEANRVNNGLRKRAEKFGYDPTATQRAKFTNVANTIAKRKSHRIRQSAQLIEYHIMVTVPLRFLAVDLFDKIPLMKGAYINMNLNVHSGNSAFTIAHANKAITVPNSSTKFGVMPVQLSQASTTGGWQTTADCDVTVHCGIYSANGSTADFGQSSALFHAVLYKMRPEVEMQYLRTNANKKIDYTVVHTNRPSAPTVAGGRFQFQVVNSMSKMRWLLVHTQLASTVNGAADATATTGGLVSCPESLFSSSPATCMKEASMINLQIKIGSVSLYENPKVYDYDMFINEIRGAASIDGGLELGSSSGLLDEKNWSEGYGYIFIDLSRYEDDAQDNVPKGLEIIGTNNTRNSVQYTFYLGHEQTFNVSTATGKVTTE